MKKKTAKEDEEKEEEGEDEEGEEEVVEADPSLLKILALNASMFTTATLYESLRLEGSYPSRDSHSWTFISIRFVHL